jgi:hypothetical protein
LTTTKSAREALFRTTPAAITSPAASTDTALALSSPPPLPFTVACHADASGVHAIVQIPAISSHRLTFHPPGLQVSSRPHATQSQKCSGGNNRPGGS